MVVGVDQTRGDEAPGRVDRVGGRGPIVVGATDAADQPVGDGDPPAVEFASFVVDGRSSRSIVEAVDPHGIGIRFGNFYSARLIDALGLDGADGVVRVSMVH